MNLKIFLWKLGQNQSSPDFYKVSRRKLADSDLLSIFLFLKFLFKKLTNLHYSFPDSSLQPPSS